MGRRGASGKQNRNGRQRRGYGPTGFEDQGGYMAAKKAKLSNQFNKVAESNFGEDRQGIFRGVAIFVNGYTEPTAEELKRIMLAHGGTFHHYYSRSKTTHIIANNLPDTKIKNMNTDRIVSPKWISESLKAGYLLDFTKFVLYTNQSSKQPKIMFKKVPSMDSTDRHDDSESSRMTLGGDNTTLTEMTHSGSSSMTLDNNSTSMRGMSQSSERSVRSLHTYHSEDEDMFADFPESSTKDSRLDSESNLRTDGDADLFADSPEMKTPEKESRSKSTMRELGDEDLFSDLQSENKDDCMDKDHVLQLDEDEDLFYNISTQEEKSSRLDSEKALKARGDEDLFSDVPEVSKDAMVHSDSTITSKVNRPLNDKEQISKSVVGNASNAPSHPRSSVSPNTSPMKGHSMSTANPKFLSEFYNNSRLHHISTMGATFKQYVTEMQSKKGGFPGREALKQWAGSKGSERGNSAGEASTPHAKNISKNKRTIMHIDMDCFFVSVGLRKHPELRGKPVAVTHSRGGGRTQAREGVDRQYELNFYKERAEKRLQDKIKSANISKAQESHPVSSTDDESKDTKQKKDVDVEPSSAAPKFSSLPLIDETCSMAEIASCSYEARKAGVRNGMFMGPAVKLCPNLKTIPYDFEGYKEVAYKLYDIVARYTHDIEAVSCDEMYVDLTELLNDCKVTPLEFASFLRKEVQDATGCPCSAGMGPNMLIARMATRRAKPNGQYMADAERSSEYMLNEKVSDLPGVGWSLGKRLESLNIKTCADLQVKSLGQLQALFGSKTGQSLYYYCRGIDDRPVKSEHVRKSVSAEVNYGIRFTCQADAERFISELAAEVENRLTAIHLKGKCITLKLKVRAKDAPVETAKFMGHGVCDNIAKSVSLSAATSSSSTIEREVMTLLRQIKVPPQDFRGVGIQVSRLEGHQGSSGSGSSGSASIKSFMLSAKAKNQRASTNNREPEAGSSTSMCSKSFVGNSDRKITISDQSQPSTSTGKPPTSLAITAKSAPPSKGDIDLEVLMALPEDMREQVMAEYRQQGYTVPKSYHEFLDKEKPGTSDPQLSTSFSPAVNREEKNEKFGTEDREGPNVVRPVPCQREEAQSGRTGFTSDDSDNELITSFSQVDSSFLAALPEEMREELRMDFEHKKRLAAGASHLPRQPLTENGPFQGRVTTHPKEQSTVNDLRRMVLEKPLGKPATQGIRGGKRRGRPPKTAGQTSRKSPVKTSKKVVVTSPRKVSTPALGSISAPQDSNTNSSSQDSFVGSSSAVSSADNENSAEEKHKREAPALCGAVELAEVKDLIREWVSSCPNPEEEDVDIIATYYTSLVTFRDLEKVDLLIKYLYRQVLRTHNQLWQLAYNNIIDRVQSVMLFLYEVKLKVTSIALEEIS